MSDPFHIEGPACISFSGGRTSAYMLWRILQSHGGKLPDDVVVCFANTGKEMEETLRFVKRCGDEWNVPIVWLEYRNDETKFSVVTFETASRNGEPFIELIKAKQYLPNPVTRFCTIELKIRAMGRYLHSVGVARTKTDGENMSILGMRADEQRRSAKISDRSRIPLVAAGITKKHVGDFWRNYHFDLELENNNGVTMHGNCDLCFLKGAWQVQTLINEKPERAAWWIEAEALALALASKPDGAKFRKDRPSYAQMLKFSQQQQNLFDVQEETIPCFCGD